MANYNDIYNAVKEAVARLALLSSQLQQMMVADQNTDVTIDGYGPKASFSKQILAAVDAVIGNDSGPYDRYNVPLFVDEQGNVPLWLANGKLAGMGLDDSMRDVVDAGIAVKVPLFVDDQGNVPVWLENGLLNAVGLAPDLVPEQPDSLDYSHTEAEQLWLYRAKRAKLDLGVAAKLKIGLAGDSWAEHRTIAQVIANYFYARYGKSADGWIQMNIDNVNQLNDIVLTRSGFSIYDASATTAAPTYPTSMDGQYIFTTSTAATLSLTKVEGQTLTIFYYDGDGTFSYSLNGGAYLPVAGGNTGTIKTLTLSGLTAGATNSLGINTTANTGTVVLYGFYAESSASGVEVDKMGNGGITAPGYAKTLPYLAQTATQVAPDVLVMIIATNDYRLSVAPADFKQGIIDWVTAWQTALPDTGIILVAPPQCNATGANPLTAFRDAMREVADLLGVEFYSLYDYMNTTYAKSNSQGLWKDNLHLSDTGGRFLLNQLNHHFLGD